MHLLSVRNGTELPLSLRHLVPGAGDSVPSLEVRGAEQTPPLYRRGVGGRGAGH